MRRLFLPLSLCTLLLLLNACAPPVKERFFWPPPPTEPKLEFIGVYERGEHLLTGSLAAISKNIVGDASIALRQPTGVAINDTGKLFITEPTRNTIKVFDFVNERADSYTSSAVPGAFGIDIDSKGNLYVVEKKNKKVTVFNSQQQAVHSIGDGILIDPMRVAVDEERGRIYVSDREDNQVLVFTPKGDLIQKIGNPEGYRSGADGEFNRPNGLAIDKSGNLWVCDQLNARIQAFDPNGTFIRNFGVRSDSLTGFEGPVDLEFDTFGNLWIVDVRKNALMAYAVDKADPEFLVAVYPPIPSPGKYSFVSMMALAIDQNNRIYVADALGRRISVLQILDERYLAQHPLPANWMQRTDVLEVWYRDSGIAPPARDAQQSQAPAKP